MSIPLTLLGIMLYGLFMTYVDAYAVPKSKYIDNHYGEVVEVTDVDGLDVFYIDKAGHKMQSKTLSFWLNYHREE